MSHTNQRVTSPSAINDRLAKKEALKLFAGDLRKRNPSLSRQVARSLALGRSLDFGQVYSPKAAYRAWVKAEHYLPNGKREVARRLQQASVASYNA